MAGGCVDEHTADQIIPYMLLAPGESIVRVGTLTKHTRDAIEAIHALMRGASLSADDLFRVTEDPTNGTFVISCRGTGAKGRA